MIAQKWNYLYSSLTMEYACHVENASHWYTDNRRYIFQHGFYKLKIQHWWVDNNVIPIWKVTNGRGETKWLVKVNYVAHLQSPDSHTHWIWLQIMNDNFSPSIPSYFLQHLWTSCLWNQLLGTWWSH